MNKELSALLVSIALLGAGCGGSPVQTAEEKEAKTISFCKTVVDVIKPDDKVCGPYYDRVKREVVTDKLQAEARDKAASEARQAAIAAANDPNRTVTDEFLYVCESALKSMMKDPDSFKVNSKANAGGGLIDYTATNGFGGPVRNIFQCSTGKTIGDTQSN